jgi:UDP-glucose 4-epimerase
MKCIVTGGCGFIGINLTKKLLDLGHKVIVLDNLLVGSLPKLMEVCGDYENLQFIKYDISRDDEDDMFFGADVIYHLAGMSGIRESIKFPDVWFENNVVGTFNILETARLNNIKNVVMASSSASIGNVDPPIHEEIHMKPISPYGATKGFMELYASAYHYSYGINVSALRFSNVYGPNSTHKISLVAKFIQKILSGNEIHIYGNGEQTRDFIYVDDLLDAIYLSSLKDVGGHIFQISTGVETSVNKITNIICSSLQKRGYKIPDVVHVDPALGDIMTNYATNKKAKKLLEWSPKVDIITGIEKTIDWFVKGRNK